jgi:hypothetical protein
MLKNFLKGSLLTIYINKQGKTNIYWIFTLKYNSLNYIQEKFHPNDVFFMRFKNKFKEHCMRKFRWTSNLKINPELIRDKLHPKKILLFS